MRGTCRAQSALRPGLRGPRAAPRPSAPSRTQVSDAGAGAHGCGGSRRRRRPAPARRRRAPPAPAPPSRPAAAARAGGVSARSIGRPRAMSSSRRPAHLAPALLKVLAAQVGAGRGRKLADAARQRRLPDVHHGHHVALALLKAWRGAARVRPPRRARGAARRGAGPRRGCAPRCRARRRRCRTAAARSASSRASWRRRAAARC